MEAVKRQAEDHTKAITAPLASDSFPDDGKLKGSLGPCLPKPIQTEDEQGHQREGLGRRIITTTTTITIMITMTIRTKTRATTVMAATTVAVTTTIFLSGT